MCSFREGAHKQALLVRQRLITQCRPVQTDSVQPPAQRLHEAAPASAQTRLLQPQLVLCTPLLKLLRDAGSAGWPAPAYSESKLSEERKDKVPCHTRLMGFACALQVYLLPLQLGSVSVERLHDPLVSCSTRFIGSACLTWRPCSQAWCRSAAQQTAARLRYCTCPAIRVHGQRCRVPDTGDMLGGRGCAQPPHRKRCSFAIQTSNRKALGLFTYLGKQPVRFSSACRGWQAAPSHYCGISEVAAHPLALLVSVAEYQVKLAH